VKPFLAALTGTAVAYIVIALIVLRLIGRRVVSASWMPLFDGIVSIVLGAMSLSFLNPAGVPVIGLAFAAGLICESRESKRVLVFILLAAGAVLCGYATFISLSHAGHD
jgi:uncharacterized membrane protein YcaP (DUF421 family)